MDYYTTKVKYTRQTEEGYKNVTEVFFLTAENFSEAEKVMHEKVGAYATNNFEVNIIKKENISGCINFEQKEELPDNSYYKSKISFTTETDSGKIKEAKQDLIVFGKSIKDVTQILNGGFKEHLAGFEVKSVALTDILESFV